ncbi:PhzF family phenazine biosynthesis protein [Candidatus Woesearchaeota archaeon]|nr:PhzF family phenazine biosynthesis protein [Candidatus Woesearchaeota archaeon]
MVFVYFVNAFAKTPEGGNPAGVCLEKGLSDAHMQRIAADVGFSETAFVMPSSKADYRVRFFTPFTEVALCGHATIAAYHFMRENGQVVPGKYTQETKAGVLAIEVEKNAVWMDQNPPQYLGVLDRSVSSWLERV